MAISFSFKNLASQALSVTFENAPLCQVDAILDRLPASFKKNYLYPPFDQPSITLLKEDPYLSNPIRPFFAKYDHPKKAFLYQSPKDLLNLPQLRYLHFKIQSVTTLLFKISSYQGILLSSQDLHRLLMISSRLNIPRVVQDILDNKAIPLPPESIEKALLNTIRNGCPDLSRRILENYDCSLLTHEMINRALFVALNGKYTESLKHVLYFAPPSLSGIGYALQLAAESGETPIVDAILSFKEKFTFPEIYINEAFIYAAADGHTHVLEKILHTFGEDKITLLHRKHAVIMAHHSNHKLLAEQLSTMFNLKLDEVIDLTGPLYVERAI